jgi:RNA polymerase-binding transcription factor DksA
MLTQAELNAAKQRLQVLLDRLEHERAGLSAEAFGPGSEEGGGWDVPRRPDEQGGVGLEDEVTLGLLNNEERLITQIANALARLKANTYGCCANCGRPISARRLRAIPYASDCIACARLAPPASADR